MNKLNAYAAILKFINGRNNSPDSLRDICEYITDPAKTDNGTLVETYGCSKEHPLEDMLANKRLHNKSHGRQYEHFVFAPCPNGSAKSPEAILKVIKEMNATLFPEYMAIISVHTDTKVVHAHSIIDAVNAVTGRKFSQGPAELNRNKQKANSILKKHGFEIITASANDFVDHTDYSKEEGFAFLELDESKFITESTVEEISAFTDSVDLTDEFEGFSNAWYQVGNYNNNNYGGYPMNNNPYTYQTQAMPVTTPTAEVIPSTAPVNTMVAQPQEPTVPAAAGETVPTAVATTGNSYPNTNVITGPVFRIKGTPDSNFAGLNELVDQATVYAQEHQREAANLALAMQQYGQQTGYPSNVSVISGPVFDIDTFGGMYPSLPNDEGYNT